MSVLLSRGLPALLCVLAWAMPSAQAAVLNFDNPGAIVIDNITNVATYHEAGFKIEGDATTFLTLQNGLLGFSGAPITLTADDNSAFSLQSLEQMFFDIGFGEQPGDLTITGLLNGLQVASQTLTLANTGNLATVLFGINWLSVDAVSFVATSAYLLDTITVVPEPGSLALVGLMLMILVLRAGKKTPAGPMALAVPA